MVILILLGLVGVVAFLGIGALTSMIVYYRGGLVIMIIWDALYVTATYLLFSIAHKSSGYSPRDNDLPDFRSAVIDPYAGTDPTDLAFWD